MTEISPISRRMIEDMTVRNFSPASGFAVRSDKDYNNAI